MAVISLPDILKNHKLKFIKTSIHYNKDLEKWIKQPMEKDWNNGVHYGFDSISFNHYLQSNNSYGVLCGYGNLIVIDADDERLIHAVIANLPETFTVKTLNDSAHFYYYIRGLKKSKALNSTSGFNLGHLSSYGRFVIGPGSIAADGRKYMIQINKPIATISMQQLKDALPEFFEEYKPLVHRGEDKHLQIEELVDLSHAHIYKNRDTTEYQIVHPKHLPSKGGRTLSINVDKQLWHCWVCGGGGDALSLIAVLHGLVNCEDCKRGTNPLKGEVLRKTLQIAKQNYGLKKTQQISHVKEVLIVIKKLKRYNETVQQKGFITTKQICIEIGENPTRGNLISLGMFINNQLNIPTVRKHSGKVIELNKKNRERLYRLFSKYKIFV